ncbi:MAG TPA: transglutaminase-like domain-containing protein [Nitrososphaeraceae archaeon]|nr:transglutaminase-like domain-containing protein [Nitrososphaeraceae archaeon]
MTKNIQAALNDWHASVVSKMTINDPSKLAEYALHISRIVAYDNLTITEELGKIEEISKKVAKSLKSSSEFRPTQFIEKINHQLYKIENFRGNRDDYYNPSNSLLNTVIKRKTGNPITLSILYIQLAKSLNFTLYPVNFPSHFMVKHVLDDEENEIIIDPFNEGRIMDDYSLKELLDHFYPKMNIALTRKLVDKASNPDVIIRMLNNLKTSFFECQDLDNAELVNEMILDIDRNNQHGLRDKGMVCLHKRRYDEALKFFNMYLEKFPESNDVDTILELIRKIKTSDL